MKLTEADFFNEIKQYLDAKYGESYTFSPLMIDPSTLGVQMAIMEKTNHGVERKFDLIIKDRGEQIKTTSIPDAFKHTKLLIALHDIEKCCDNHNPTHEEIWTIAHDAINNYLKQYIEIK